MAAMESIGMKVDRAVLESVGIELDARINLIWKIQFMKKQDSHSILNRLNNWVWYYSKIWEFLILVVVKEDWILYIGRCFREAERRAAYR